MEIKIEKGVAIPARMTKPRKWDFTHFEVGDSALISAPINNVRSGVLHWCEKRPGVKFTVRQMEDGVRIWRIA